MLFTTMETTIIHVKYEVYMLFCSTHIQNVLMDVVLIIANVKNVCMTFLLDLNKKEMDTEIELLTIKKEGSNHKKKKKVTFNTKEPDCYFTRRKQTIICISLFVNLMLAISGGVCGFYLKKTLNESDLYTEIQTCKIINNRYYNHNDLELIHVQYVFDYCDNGRSTFEYDFAFNTSDVLSIPQKYDIVSLVCNPSCFKCELLPKYSTRYKEQSIVLLYISLVVIILFAVIFNVISTIHFVDSKCWNKGISYYILPSKKSNN